MTTSDRRVPSEMIICRYSIFFKSPQVLPTDKGLCSRTIVPVGLQQALRGQPVDDDFALVAATPLQAIDQPVARATKFVISDRLALRRQMDGTLTGRMLAVHSWFH